MVMCLEKIESVKNLANMLIKCADVGTLRLCNEDVDKSSKQLVWCSEDADSGLRMKFLVDWITLSTIELLGDGVCFLFIASYL